MNSNSAIKIAPSILAADFGRLRSEVESVTEAGADWLHIDVMDGKFVPPITFGDNIVGMAKQCTDLPLDVHLMVIEPEHKVQSFVDAGADLITVHQEACVHMHRTLEEIKKSGIQCGVAINPATPVGVLSEVIPIVDLVLIMTVNPGWGGQSFIQSCLEKIRHVRDHINEAGSSAVVEVDGGINPETAAACVSAGASVLVAGSYIFNEPDRKEAIASLR